MKKFLLAVLILFLAQVQSFAYVEKVYNECGERVGTVRKNGDVIEWYDIDGNKVNGYEDLTKTENSDGKTRIVIGMPRRYLNPFVNTDSCECSKNVYYIPKGRYIFVPNKFYGGF